MNAFFVDFAHNPHAISAMSDLLDNLPAKRKFLMICQAGDRLDGDLRLRGGDLFRDTDIDDNYTFTGTVRGALSDAGTPYDIDAEINGEFRGRNQDGLTGVLFGDVVGPLGQDIFDGDFFAGRAPD